jgi:uncharacterized protein (UPF0303 family)
MSMEEDLRVIAEQERLLRFATFTTEMAWQIGSALRAAAMARDASMTFEITLAGRTLFHTVTGERAGAGQADWIRRKRNTVLRFGRSSYAMGLELEATGLTMEARHGLPVADYAMHGGGMPLTMAGAGCIGAVVSSGLHQRDDHAMVIAAMAGVMGVDVPVLKPLG